MPGEYRSSHISRRGYVTYIAEKTGAVKMREIEMSLVNGRWLFEGDIVINTEAGLAAAEEQGVRLLAGEQAPGVDLARRAAGTVVDGCVILGTYYLWPEATVYYIIDPALPDKWRVTNAMAHWEYQTPIRFKKCLNPYDMDYVLFTPGDGCSSSVGRQSGMQEITLASGCSQGNAIHEIGHAIGLWHEQSRADRDNFVTVHYENIESGYSHNFDQNISDGEDVGTYDYDSLMHYGRTAFSVNGLDTITPPAGVTIGQRDGLSAGDIQAVSYLYDSTFQYMGSKKAREIHHPSCFHAHLVGPFNRVYFNSVQEGLDAGWDGCYYCLGRYHTR